MPRELVLGNGELLVNLDRFLSVRDIYFPYVGWANHVGGHKCRVGVWTEGGQFAWLDETWEWDVQYQRDTLVTDCAGVHHGLGVRLRVAHAVLHDRNVYVARFAVDNLRDEAREARLFLHHDLRIEESDIGDTCFFHPGGQALIHYKRDRYFLFGGCVGKDVNADGARLFQYACGEKEFKGAEGTWRDAEDGLLSMNAIAQGAVDSAVSFRLMLPALGKNTLRTWMTVGETLDEALDAQGQLLQTGYDKALDDTAVYWFGVTRSLRPDLDRLPPRVADLFTRSVLIIRTQCDRRGAILASNDSDIMETARAHYSYLWPRDGALVSAALDSVGLKEISRPFFEFCARVLPKDRAALMHKYGPDGTVGASWHPWIVDGVPETPFQEDGTALVLYALWQHVLHHGDLGFAEKLYAKLVRPAAEFLAYYRHPVTHLPLPSWDIWEERRGTHIWTTASVIAALNAAADCAHALGEKAQSDTFRAAAAETRVALLEHFWNEDARCFARMVIMDEEGKVTRDTMVDASLAAVFLFGVLPADDPHVAASMETLGRKLWVRAGAGGVARYERDYYFHVTDDFDKVPGNPWLICTLWLADWYVATAHTKEDLRRAADLLEWVVLCALPTGVLPEQANPFTLAPLSVAPLTWSHAQFVSTATGYLNKLAELETVPA